MSNVAPLCHYLAKLVFQNIWLFCFDVLNRFAQSAFKYSLLCVRFISDIFLKILAALTFINWGRSL